MHLLHRAGGPRPDPRESDASPGPIDHILVETTGLADPAPVAQTFFVDKEIGDTAGARRHRDLVDARHILEHLDEVKPDGVENEAVEQVAFADRIVINKIDLVMARGTRPRVAEAPLPAVNAHGPDRAGRPAGPGRPRPDPGSRCFDLSRTLEMDPTFLEQTEQLHDQSVTSVGIELAGDLDPERLNRFIGRAFVAEGYRYLPDEGDPVAMAGDNDRYVCQGVRVLFDGDEWITRGATSRAWIGWSSSEATSTGRRSPTTSPRASSARRDRPRPRPPRPSLPRSGRYAIG